MNINVFYKQNYANKGVGDIAHAPGISKQSCLLLFQIYSGCCCGLGGPALAVGNGDDSDCEVKREVLQCSDWDG